MLHTLKKRLYFIVAAYFAFRARIVLQRWKPRIVVITGSSGKTTVLHLVEAQLGGQAIYSHHANSAIGVPFNILGLHSNVGSLFKWPTYFLRAPFCVFRRLPKTKLYIAEADCDRPGEGNFLSKLLKPEVTIWVSVYRTHSMNFDKQVDSGKFKTHEEAIANEFGYFAVHPSSLVITSDHQPAIISQLSRIPKSTKLILTKDKEITDYQLLQKETVFTVKGEQLHLPGLHPRALGNSLQMVDELLSYLDQPLDDMYKKLQMPPGRSNVFAGKKATTIIDSTYNTGLGAMKEIINLFENYKADNKWLVLGDILEQGSVEAEEHERLAEAIKLAKFDQLVLLGPRVMAHTFPIIRKLGRPVVCFESPSEVLEYLNANLQGGETLLFKGARGLEGVIEQLLEDPNDAAKLVRREPIWIKRRQQWGLPR